MHCVCFKPDIPLAVTRYFHKLCKHIPERAPFKLSTNSSDRAINKYNIQIRAGSKGSNTDEMKNSTGIVIDITAEQTFDTRLSEIKSDMSFVIFFVVIHERLSAQIIIK